MQDFCLFILLSSLIQSCHAERKLLSDRTLWNSFITFFNVELNLFGKMDIKLCGYHFLVSGNLYSRSAPLLCMSVLKRCKLGTVHVFGKLLDLSLCITPDLNIHVNKFSILLVSHAKTYICEKKHS